MNNLDACPIRLHKIIWTYFFGDVPKAQPHVEYLGGMKNKQLILYEKTTFVKPRRSYLFPLQYYLGSIFWSLDPEILLHIHALEWPPSPLMTVISAGEHIKK